MYVWLFRNIRRKNQFKNTKANNPIISGLSLEDFVLAFYIPDVLLFDEVCVLVVGSYPFFLIYLLHESGRLFIVRQVLSRWYKYRDLCRYIDVCTAVVLILYIDADLDMYIFEIS